MRQKLSLAIVSASLGLCGVLTALGAHAQTDSAAARLLFEEGRDLLKHDHVAEACPKFEQSYQRDPGIGTLFNLADCWQRLGRTASAWAKFRDVADEAARTNQREREQVALKRAAELLPQLSKVVVRIPSKAPGLQLFRDGIAMLESDEGKPFPLDPGAHDFEAKAPGKQAWKTTITVPPKGQNVEVVVPELQAAASESKPQPAQPDANAAAVDKSSSVALAGATEPDRDHAGSSSNQKTLAYVAGGVGVAGIAVGTIFGLRYSSKNSKASGICPTSNGCTEQEKSDYALAVSDAKAARTIAFVGFGVGGAALVTGAILYFTAPKSHPTALRFTPIIQVGQVGAVFEGAY